MGRRREVSAARLAWLQRSMFVPNSADSSGLVESASGQGLGYGQMAPSLAWRINDVWRVLVEMTAGFHRAPAMYAMVAMWPLVISISLVLTDFARPVGERCKGATRISSKRTISDEKDVMERLRTAVTGRTRASSS